MIRKLFLYEVFFRVQNTSIDVPVGLESLFSFGVGFGFFALQVFTPCFFN